MDWWVWICNGLISILVTGRVSYIPCVYSVLGWIYQSYKPNSFFKSRFSYAGFYCTASFWHRCSIMSNVTEIVPLFFFVVIIGSFVFISLSGRPTRTAGKRRGTVWIPNQCIGGVLENHPVSPSPIWLSHSTLLW